MNYKKLSKNSKRFISFTGYTTEEFEALLPYFDAAFEEHVAKHLLHGKRRTARKHVDYFNSPLPDGKSRLLFILMHHKLHLLQEVQAEMFDMEQAQCSRFIKLLLPILHHALDKAQALPARSDGELQEKLAEQTDKELLHDGTEREIPRPKDEQAQKDNYSGKKKKHTVKNGVIISLCCTILFLSPTVAGKVHDKKVADLYYTIAKGFRLWQDTGYQGYRPEGVTIMQPIKKPRGKELTEEQKAYNRTIASFRIRVEHAIGSCKRYRIVKEEIRHRCTEFVDMALANCCGLHNFRMRFRPFIYDVAPVF